MSLMNLSDVPNKEENTNPDLVAEIERKAKDALPGNAWELADTIVRKRRLWRQGNFLPDLISATPDDVYKAICGHSAYDCQTINDFFHPELYRIIVLIFGEDEANNIRAECELETELPKMVIFSPNSFTTYRMPYRTGRIADHVDSFFSVIVGAIKFACHGLSLEQAMLKDAPQQRLAGRIALALRRRDNGVSDLIKEAIFGDNNTIPFSNSIISAIVRSGEPEPLEMLGKMLLAAKTQEGLRQSILQLCDRGTLSSHEFFIRLILENGLCRFSSVIRAFDTWTGLGLSNQKQKTVEKCMALALKYLSDPNSANDGPDSNDTTEIYMALWALACRDINRAAGTAERLLDCPEKYKRLVGWYFITQTAGETFRHNMAVKHLDVRDPEELAWICMNLDNNIRGLSGMLYAPEGLQHEIDEKELAIRTYPNKNYPAEARARAELFDKLAAVALFIGNKKTKFNESVFPWYSVDLTSDKPCTSMVILAAYDRCPELTVRLSDFLHVMNVGIRMIYYMRLLNPGIPVQRDLLMEGISDKSSSVKELIVRIFRKYPLTGNELSRFTEALTTQKADVRKSIITLMSIQTEKLIRPALSSLIDSKNKNQLIAGVELLKIFGDKNPALIKEYHDKLSSLTQNQDLGQDVSILLGQITKSDNDEFTDDNAYGMFDPSSEVFSPEYWVKRRPNNKPISIDELKTLLVPEEKSLTELYDRITDVFYKNRNYEYEIEESSAWSNTRGKTLLGDDPYRVCLPAGVTRGRYGNPITDYPLADEWLTAAGEYAGQKMKLAAVMAIFSNYYYQSRILSKWFTELTDGLPIGETGVLIQRNLDAYITPKGVGAIKATQILEAVFNTDQCNMFDEFFSVYISLINLIPPERLGDKIYEKDRPENELRYENEHDYVLSLPYFGFWRYKAYRNIESDAQFTAWFNEMWYEHLAAGGKFYYGIDDEDVFRAHHLGLIPDDVIYAWFTTLHKAGEHMRSMSLYKSGRTQELLSKYPATGDVLDNIIDRVVSVEENRGELPTKLTQIAVNIGYFNGGIRHFAKLLVAMGDAGFYRGYVYYRSKEITKQESLSYLLRMCRPAPGDTPEALRDALKKAGISVKRIIQTAVYAPMWAGMLERAMGIPGLKCGVWYFHAHVNEHFSVEKETETAIFSAISPQQFRDGAFDKNWFFEAYNTLGEKTFNELYKNAKYITDSSNAHRRSQLYSDAVLGRMDKDSAKAEIIEKRNQEKLRAYALIPLDVNNKNDALERYEFIRKFRKESRQFGQLRQSSEDTACRIALENLAITTGYNDVDRMTWALEGAKIEQLAPLMQPRSLGGAEVWLSISESGDPILNATKSGKPLKTLPKELANDPYIVELKETVKQLREQKSRAKFSFEMAMVSG